MKYNITSLIDKVDRLQDRYDLIDKQHIAIDGNSITLIEDQRKYIPLATSTLFHNCNSSVRLMIGPYGSGKTSACCAEILLRACAMPPSNDAIRRSRCVIIRNTSGMLETTTLKTWLHWFGNLGVYTSRKKPVMSYNYQFNDGRGIVELELMFLALDRDDDVKKLKSLECTFAYINEASELPAGLLPHLKSRINRYPSHDTVGIYWSGIFMDSNPPDTEHWIYKTFESEPDEQYKLFKQPPALIKSEDHWILNPKAENIQNHDPNYYFNLAHGATQEFIKVYVLGDYGMVMDGKVVYSGYNDDLHSVGSIPIVKDEPILLGWDFGLTPACLVMQEIKGQLRCIKEFTTDRMGLRELTTVLVLPWLGSSCPTNPILSTCDPSGNRGMDTDTTNCIELLNELGIPTEPARSNVISTRVDSVSERINRLTEGKPALIVSREACQELRKGFLGKYCYKRVRVLNEEKYRDIPDKSHPTSDIQDCLQYGALYLSSTSIKNGVKFDAKDYMIPSQSMWV